MTRRFRGADYQIVFHHTEEGVFRLTVDGKEVGGELVPDFRDGGRHLVEVEL